MTSQQSLPTKKFASAKAWQTWLAKNHDKSNGVWMIFTKKNADKHTVTYAEALDVALCYGWIDGQKNSYDEQYWMQKFVPRKPKSIWSKKNIEHTKRLIKEGRMQPAGLEAIETAKVNGTWEKAYDAQSNMIVPEDFLKALQKNKKANAFFKTLNRTNLFSIAFRLQTAKKEETKQKRIAKIIDMLEREEKFH
jgi:uncharacterized protein YdeI (YjbR/CyaY-like superfamily)